MWLCWHVGTVSDGKLTVVARRAGVPKHLVIAIWALLLETAAEARPRGSIESIDVEGAATTLETTEEAFVAVLSALEAKQLISACSVTNWDKRNYKSTERVKAFRERKKHDETHETVSTLHASSETPETLTDRQTDITDKQEQEVRRFDSASLIKGIAENKKIPSGLPSYQDGPDAKANRKARWEQNCMTDIRATYPDAKAELIVASYMRGEKWGKQEFENADKRIKARRSLGSAA